MKVMKFLALFCFCFFSAYAFSKEEIGAVDTEFNLLGVTCCLNKICLNLFI